MRKSPEALHIFFSGPAAQKILRQENWTPLERRTIEEAIASAQSPNPDIDLLRRADRIIAGRQAPHPHRSASAHPDGGLSQLSGHFSRPEPDHKPFWQPRGRSLLGYLAWRERWKYIYVPIITLILILIVYAVVKLFPSTGERIVGSGFMGMNVGIFSKAQKICHDQGKELAATPEAILSQVKKINEAQNALGYWLRDGRVYIPKNDAIKAPDSLRHWFVCVDE